MDRQIITFEANEQTLIKTGGLDNYSSNKVSYIEAHFALGQNWAGYDSVRAVWSTRYECISTVLDTEGICVVPYEVLKWKDKVIVNLVGSISENDVLTDRITTYPIKALEVDADAKVCGSNTQPITPSEYEQFVEAVKADADRAEEAKEDARVYAGNALSSAQNALISETNASASEDNAKASELNAETYKNQAQTYAQNAHNSAISAENAKDEAEDARDTILGMRAEATTLPEGSSATASYNDGVMSFGIPKGDTGARGATGETGATPQLSIGTVTTTTEPSVTITGTAENPVLNFGLVKGDKGDTGEVSLADLSTLLPTDTASGSIASFPDGQSVIPALSVLCDIEPMQDLHGYDKPWSGGAGKNKFDIDAEHTAVAGSPTYFYSMTVKPNTAYTMSSNVPQGMPASLYFNGGATDVNGVWSGRPTTFTSDASGTLTAYVRYDTSQGGVDLYTAVRNGQYYIQLEEGSTATAYEPYSNICPISGHDEVNVYVSPTTSETDAEVYNVSFGTAGTVYGGTLDVVSGVLTVDRAIVDLGSLDWTRDSQSNRFYTTGISELVKRPSDNYEVADSVCSAYSVTSLNQFWNSTDGKYAISITGAVSIRDSKYADATAFKTAMIGVQLCYELTTPQTIQLTPQEVELLLGQNNVWADTGDVEVTYKADVTKWVEKQQAQEEQNFSALIAPTETSNKASRNYTSGSLLIMNNILYKATANIQGGGTITPNTNVTATTLAEVIASL